MSIYEQALVLSFPQILREMMAWGFEEIYTQ